MRLKRIEFRNIGPFGNKLQTLDIPPEGGLWMITGKNGYGKTSFVNLPKILYYGRLDKFKKDEIANRLNKHGWIKGLVEVKPDTYVTIERSFSPTNLNVWKHGKYEEPNNENNIGKAGIINYQEYIDTEVTNLPYHIFSNIISLSINDFKSFISMTPHDKRIIIDKLFAMEIINKMNELVRRDLREIKINIEVFEREINSLKSNIDVAIKELQKLKNKINENTNVKITQLAKQLELYKPKLEEGYEKKREWEKKKEDITKSQNIFIKQKAKIIQTIKHLEKQINLYKQEKCPTCATPFNDKSFDLIKGQLQEDINEQLKKLDELKYEEEKYSSTLLKINKGLETINTFIINIQSAYRTIESEMNKLKIDKPQEFTSIQNIIADNTNILNIKGEEKIKQDEKYKYLSILEQLYSDSGIKKRILENYLPTLNKEIEYSLNELHFPYNLIFDSEFEPLITDLGLKIGVDTLSTGEKKKVDLAVLISIIRMLKQKYPKLNMFMLDEVLSSIDGDGIFDIIGILHKLSKDLKINIFIISFNLLPIEQFDYRIEIQKNARFSDFHIEKLNKKIENI